MKESFSNIATTYTGIKKAQTRIVVYHQHHLGGYSPLRLFGSRFYKAQEGQT
jgi:hypothetical protein